MWMVRCDGGQLAETFFEQNMVGIGWGEVGNLSGFTREQVIEKVRSTWPDYKSRKSVMIGSQLFKIASVFKAGDQVITYDPSKRTYSIGRISGNYYFDQSAQDTISHRRKVTTGIA